VSRIGLISDTHGLVRPQALAALAGCTRILHAGDIGDPAVLDTLSAIAPVTAVRGNNDTGQWAAQFPATARVTSGGTRILVLHDIAELGMDPAKAGIHVVVTGHSHKPAIVERDGVLYVNPGSAGPRRFRLPISVALLEVDGRMPLAELITLDIGSSAGQPC
jgi:putative phosphoesterase